MGKPTLTGLPGNILVSAAVLWVDGVDIGFASGIQVKPKHETTEVRTDQLGKTVINRYHVGDTIQVEATLDELTAQKLKKAFPHGKLIGTGFGPYRITWGKPIGDDYFSLAKLLEVKPTADDQANYGRNFKFWKAVPVGDASIPFKPDGKAEIKIMFDIYPDLTQPEGLFYGFFGDPSAGAIVPASAAAAVPGGGNVGNGTVGSILVNDIYTKTETWTLTCIAAIANSGLFEVVGSVSGAKGVATVGTTFNSNVLVPSQSEISFLIADGATDFAVGDVFTIATTAKNYV